VGGWVVGESRDGWVGVRMVGWVVGWIYQWLGHWLRDWVCLGVLKWVVGGSRDGWVGGWWV